MGCFGSSDPNAKLIQEACRGKTEEQKKVIEYFVKQEGCFSKNMTSDEYLALVAKKKDSMNFRSIAINKIGLDEDEINEIPPVKFEGFVFKNAYSKSLPSGNYISSSYQVAWLFFSSTQVYIYRHTFNMDDSKKNESTDEFFYKDVTSFSTSTQTETSRNVAGQSIEVPTNKFCMVVPGDKLYVSMDGVEDAESIVQAMKQKLREKKS
ncbi:hypothetical protein RFF05_03755 [Bengtsoniella intestinalis]|uniref:hypothetical protein n=1 Tax=Bengtsoniella intestinalis TaxID=3073143 RepID=UPI00391F1011